MNVLEVAAAIILDSQFPLTLQGYDDKSDSAKEEYSVLISLRKKESHQGGLWEFPGGKVECDESPEQALKRELKEELNLSICSAEPFETIQHHYSDKSVKIHFFIVNHFLGKPSSMEGQTFKWVALNKLDELAFPKANLEVITSLQKRFRKP